MGGAFGVQADAAADDEEEEKWEEEEEEEEAGKDYLRVERHSPFSFFNQPQKREDEVIRTSSHTIRGNKVF